jgi:hypothetical protein
MHFSFPSKLVKGLPLLSFPSETLSLGPIYISDVFRAIKVLGPPKSIGFYEIPDFVF